MCRLLYCIKQACPRAARPSQCEDEPTSKHTLCDTSPPFWQRQGSCAHLCSLPLSLSCGPHQARQRVHPNAIFTRSHLMCQSCHRTSHSYVCTQAPMGYTIEQDARVPDFLHHGAHQHCICVAAVVPTPCHLFQSSCSVSRPTLTFVHCRMRVATAASVGVSWIVIRIICAHTHTQPLVACNTYCWHC